jgi:hypothetical protein
VTGKENPWPRSIGVQVGAGTLGDLWNIDNFPMDVDPRRTEGQRTTRILADGAEKPMGEWNDYEIRLNGEELTVMVNGTRQNVAWHCQVVPGKIALRSDGAVYEVRNLQLRRLPDQGVMDKKLAD